MSATVLVVEDDFTTREAVTSVLRHEGYDAAAAEDGSKALGYLRTHPAPSLILLDLMMPVMDGWHFLDVRRGESALAAVPVVVFSASGGLDVNALLALGADSLLRKPAEPEDLLKVVRRYC